MNTPETQPEPLPQAHGSAEIIEALRILHGNLRAIEQSWRNAPEDTHRISMSVMVALAEVANALERTCKALTPPNTEVSGAGPLTHPETAAAPPRPLH